MLILPVFPFPPPVKQAAFAWLLPSLQTPKQRPSPSHSSRSNFILAVVSLQVNNQFILSTASLFTFEPTVYYTFMDIFFFPALCQYGRSAQQRQPEAKCLFAFPNAVFVAGWLANSRCRLATCVPGVFHRKFPLIAAGDNGATMSRPSYCRKEGKWGAK